MTKATIKKAAKAAGVDLSLIKITKIGGVYGLEDTDLPADLARRNVEYEGAGQLPEVEKRISQYNRAVKKLVKAIPRHAKRKPYRDVWLMKNETIPKFV